MYLCVVIFSTQKKTKHQRVILLYPTIAIPKHTQSNNNVREDGVYVHILLYRMVCSTILARFFLQKNRHKIRMAHKYHHHPTHRALMYTYNIPMYIPKYKIPTHYIRTSPHPGIFSKHTTLFTQTRTFCNRLLYCFLMFSPLFLFPHYFIWLIFCSYLLRLFFSCYFRNEISKSVMFFFSFPVHSSSCFQKQKMKEDEALQKIKENAGNWLFIHTLLSFQELGALYKTSTSFVSLFQEFSTTGYTYV